jgi:N-acetylglucosamine transport system substrate-binding protein
MKKRNFTRRQFLKGTAAAGGALFASQWLPAFAQEGLPFEVAPEAVNPLGLEAGKSVEGVLFEGGYGRGYIDNAADIFRAVHPDNEITVEGIQRVGPTLRPRFIQGAPPDVIDNSGAENLPMDGLVADDQLADLAPLMEAPALDTPGKTFAETLFPGSQADGVFNGKQLYLNVGFTVSGVWLSQSLFEEKGWEYAKTWDDHLALCETIKMAGIAPWTYQGQYPGYMQWGVLEPLIVKIGGLQAIIDIDNLVDGAWTADPVLQAATMMAQLVENDYILAGTEGLSHTESQAEWLQNHAAFIPCGSWLENEMRELTPEGFNMVVKQVPGPTEDTYPVLLAWPGEPYIVPKNAANVVGGMEYMRCMLSKHNAQYFAKNVSAVMPVFGGTEGVELSAALVSANEAVAVAGDAVFNDFYRTWYSPLNVDGADVVGELMTGRIGPEEFCETMQGIADDVKSDDDIPKYTHS